MYVTTDIERRFRLGACLKEPWTHDWIHSLPPGSVLYDIGANVGSYTLLAAALGHTVVAIEPSFANYARLCENILLNDLGPRVIPLCMGLHNVGEVLVMAQELTPGWSGGAQRLRAPVVPMDELPGLLGVPPPTHIKLDVDGVELQVLQRTDSTAEQILIEMPTGKEVPLVQRLGAMGYKLIQSWDERDRDQAATGLTMKNWWYGLYQRSQP